MTPPVPSHHHGAPDVAPTPIRMPARYASTGSVAVRVFLLDDHELVRRGLRDLMSTDDDLAVVGDASTRPLWTPFHPARRGRA